MSMKSANIFELIKKGSGVEPPTIEQLVEDVVFEEETAEEPEAPKLDYSRWGSPKERYRHLCMLCLLYRYAYYCHSVTLVSDEQYDRLERVIREIEENNRALIHRNSPTYRVGSTDERDYPNSVLMLWGSYGGDMEALSIVGRVLEHTLDQAILDWKLVEGVREVVDDQGRGVVARGGQQEATVRERGVGGGDLERPA
jgi:hypothetical protein